MANQFLNGGVFVACLAIALLFHRSYFKTRDRLFVFFAVAFVILAVERVVLGVSTYHGGEVNPYVYFIRLLAYVFIIIAIADKNRRG